MNGCARSITVRHKHLGQQGRFSYPLLMMQSTFHNSSKGISGQRRFASALDRAGVAQ